MKSILRSFAASVALSLACLAPPVVQAQGSVVGTVAAALGGEGVNTAQIFSTTVGGAFSCLKWRLKGACVWLRCSFFGCWVESTLRVEHFTPDVTISTWHDAASHPWKDYGRTIANRLDTVGGLMMGMPFVDSSGSEGEGNGSQYRGADAFGNPANILQGALTGNFGNPLAIATSVVIPNTSELASFFGSFPTQVASQWASVPGSYTASELKAVLDTTSIWSQLMGVATDAIGVANKVMTVVNTASKVVSVAGKLSAISDGGGLPTTSPPVTSTLLPGGTFLCPTSISPFQMAFQSDMDSPFWRGVLPLESVFPATWLPGMREVGSGLTQTWGSVWPRQGNVYQTHPVKASAVLATRVGDIISNRAQPHIYTPLNLTPGGYRWFGAQGISERVAQTRWQRVFPNPTSSCGGFGANDALSLSSYGDGQNAAGQGAIWNAWRRQECCQRPKSSTYLFGIEI